MYSEQASNSQVKPCTRNDSSLPLQVDNHIAELTVRETLDFAARVLGVGHKAGAHIMAKCPVVLGFLTTLLPAGTLSGQRCRMRATKWGSVADLAASFMWQPR